MVLWQWLLLNLESELCCYCSASYVLSAVTFQEIGKCSKMVHGLCLKFAATFISYDGDGSGFKVLQNCFPLAVMLVS